MWTKCIKYKKTKITTSIHTNADLLLWCCISKFLSKCSCLSHIVTATSYTIIYHCYDIEAVLQQQLSGGSCTTQGKSRLQTLSFLPSMVLISASLPMVKELVTDLPGVLEVTTKSFPFCLISVTGLMSLAILMTSSGRSGETVCQSTLGISVHYCTAPRWRFSLGKVQMTFWKAAS